MVLEYVSQEWSEPLVDPLSVVAIEDLVVSILRDIVGVSLYIPSLFSDDLLQYNIVGPCRQSMCRQAESTHALQVFLRSNFSQHECSRFLCWFMYICVNRCTYLAYSLCALACGNCCLNSLIIAVLNDGGYEGTMGLARSVRCAHSVSLHEGHHIAQVYFHH